MIFTKPKHSSAQVHFLLGLLVGGVAVAIFAPTSGKDVRRRLGQGAKRGGDTLTSGWGKTKESAEAVAEEAQSLLERGKQAVRGEGARVQAAFDAAKTAYSEASTYSEATS